MHQAPSARASTCAKVTATHAAAARTIIRISCLLGRQESYLRNIKLSIYHNAQVT
jgi:hypothetical protein